MDKLLLTLEEIAKAKYPNFLTDGARHSWEQYVSQQDLNICKAQLAYLANISDDELLPMAKDGSFDCSVCDTEPEGCPGCGSAAYEAGSKNTLAKALPVLQARHEAEKADAVARAVNELLADMERTLPFSVVKNNPFAWGELKKRWQALQEEQGK